MLVLTAQILLRDPSEENVTPVVEELHRRLPPSVAHQAEGEGRGQHEAESAEEAGGQIYPSYYSYSFYPLRWAKFIGLDNCTGMCFRNCYKDFVMLF